MSHSKKQPVSELRRYTTSLPASGQIHLEGLSSSSYFDPTLEDSHWWKVKYDSDDEFELYSISQHELGHALFADKNYPKVGGWIHDHQDLSRLLGTYYADELFFDSSLHFSAVDPVSGSPAFGSSRSKVPRRRWWITKLDLLVAQAAGRTLKNIPAFANFTLERNALFKQVALGEQTEIFLRASASVPDFDWEVESGSLPPGLELDSISGVVSGTPVEKGIFSAKIKVQAVEALKPLYMDLQVSVK